jgi:hypothetical protein
MTPLLGIGMSVPKELLKYQHLNPKTAVEAPISQSPTEVSSRPERSVVEGPAVSLSGANAHPWRIKNEKEIRHYA